MDFSAYNTIKQCTEPPYSVGQNSANDNNANQRYPTLDARIAATYAGRSTGTNKNSLYDSYYRAYRWATDRVGDTGIVAFVSNGGWIDGNTADGVRLSFADDFAHLWIYNLRGNQRTAGELSRKEGGKVFGSGSRSTIAIFVGVKDVAHTGPVHIHYRDIGDYLDREQKLRLVAASTVHTLEWDTITPNTSGDWVGQRDDTFGTWPVIASRKSSVAVRVFGRYSLGLGTARDSWVYDYSRTALEANVRRMIDNYNALHEPFAAFCAERSITKPKEADVTTFLIANPDAAHEDHIKWSRSLRAHLARRSRVDFHKTGVRASTYRPFTAQWAYFDGHLNHERGQLPSIFPTPHHSNYGFYQVGNGSAVPFSALATDRIPDLHVTGAGSGGQLFPRYTYERVDGASGSELDFGSAADDPSVDEWGYRRIDNITDDILAVYQAALGESVTQDQIFWSVYGQLQVPSYRESYAADLKKMLPHIPTPDSYEQFMQLAVAGEELGFLHMRYEDVDPYPLDVELESGADEHDRETWRVQKMRWRSKTDHTAIVYNPKVTISGIPPEAEEYMLGSRTALAWIIDRYQVKADKASGIVTDPNLWCDEHDDPTYIVELIKKITTVSVRTMEIVKSLDATAVG